MSGYETHKVALQSGAVVEAVREGFQVKLAVTGNGEHAMIELTGHELLRVAKALEVIAMGIVTET